MHSNVKLNSFSSCLPKTKKKNWLNMLSKKNILTKHTFEIIVLSNFTIFRILELHFTHMTKIQVLGVPLQICGFDMLCAARTGSGKTFTFSIPIIEFIIALDWKFSNGLASVVINPTRELTMQNYYVFKDLLKYHKIKLGISMGGANRRTEIEKIREGIVILISTPGRLLDHLNSTAELKSKNLQILVIDEADRCMEIGFEKEMVQIFKLLPKNRQTVMLSATQSGDMKKLIKASFSKKPVFFKIDTDKITCVPGINQGFSILEQNEKIGLLIAILKKNKFKKIIVFFSSCNEVRFFSSLLRAIKMNILDLHGKQKQFKRTFTFFSFCTSPNSVLFCTDIASRGLDFPSVDWIIQFSPPTDPKEYIHRIGRTGRGVSGKGISLIFLLPSEIGLLKYLKKKNFDLEEFKFPVKNFALLNRKLNSLIEKNFFLNKLGKEAFTSFLNSYKNHLLRDIFDFKKLDIEKVYKSFGLSL